MLKCPAFPASAILCLVSMAYPVERGINEGSCSSRSVTEAAEKKSWGRGVKPRVGPGFSILVAS